jgi:hypothetical protein
MSEVFMTMQMPVAGGAGDGAADSGADSAGDKAREARDHPALSWAARLGFVAYGVVYVVVAWLAVQLAFGEGQGSAASGQGALHTLAEQPLGTVALALAAGVLAAVAVWEACQVVGGHKDREGLGRVAGRAGSAGRAVVFGTLAVLAVQVVLGDGGGGGTDGVTADLMRMPLGPWLVGAVGLAIFGYGIYSVVKGVTDRWRHEVAPDAQAGDLGTAFTALARVGFVSRGLAFCVIGALFVWAGATHDAQKSGGLDQALHRLRDAPFGQVLLTAVAVGLACYGVFNVAKAWYLRAR